MSRKCTIACGKDWHLFNDMDYPDSGESIYLEKQPSNDWRVTPGGGIYKAVTIELTPEIIEAIKNAVPSGT